MQEQRIKDFEGEKYDEINKKIKSLRFETRRLRRTESEFLQKGVASKPKRQFVKKEDKLILWQVIPKGEEGKLGSPGKLVYALEGNDKPTSVRNHDLVPLPATKTTDHNGKLMKIKIRPLKNQLSVAPDALVGELKIEKKASIPPPVKEKPLNGSLSFRQDNSTRPSQSQSVLN